MSPTPAIYTAYGTLSAELSDAQVVAALQRLTYGFKAVKGHIGDLGKLRAAVIKNEQILPGRTKQESLALIREAIEHFHALAAEQGLIPPHQRLLYRVSKLLRN